MKIFACRATRSVVSIGVGLGLAALFLFLVGSGLETARANGGDVLYVALTGVDGGDCSNGSNPCRTVQYAVDQADTGDEIRVAAGTYTDVYARPLPDGYVSANPELTVITQAVYITKTLILRGSYDPEDWEASDPDNYATTVDPQAQGRGVVIAGEISPVVENFHLVNGDATELEGANGMGDGGGIFVISATATISNNTISGNSTDAIMGEGGGVLLYWSDSLVYGNYIHTNECGFFGAGGGVSVIDSNAVLRHNSIGNNVGAYADGWGGGVDVLGGKVTLDSNTIVGNEVAGWGAGVALEDAKVDMINNIIADNELQGHPDFSMGSGVSVEGSTLNMIHNTLSRNVGGDQTGLWVVELDEDNPSVVNMTNTILVSHTVGITVTTGNTVTLNSTFWAGGTAWANGVNWGGEGTVDAVANYDGAPDFAAPDSGNYRIALNSAAMDLGVDAGIYVDIDGISRPQGPGFDLGASEYVQHFFYLPVVFNGK